MSPHTQHQHAKRGFTLLEVLIAVAILGLGLSVILSAQAGLFNNAARAENMSLAPELLRCKMNEVELDLLEKGYGVIDQKDSGPCCADESDKRFSCEWKVELIKLPEPSSGAFSGDAGIAGDNGGLGALGALAQSGGLGAASADGKPPDLGSLASSLSEAGGNPIDGVAGIVMSMVYPQLKPMLEASIRRVTVSVVWKEGKNRRELSAVQFVTNPQQGGLDANAAAGLEGLEDLAGGLTGGTSPTGGGNPGGVNPGGNGLSRGPSPFGPRRNP
ncbi:MAG: type II secretion system protein [Polyangiaceae bacterium]